MTTVRRRLAALVAVIVATFTPMVVPAAQADEYPVLTTDGTICYERRAGGGGWIITVEVSEPFKDDITFQVSTQDGSAVAPDDYTAIERVEFRIPAGKLSIDIPLEIIEDKVREDDEWFLVTLHSAVGAIIGTDKAEIIIKDGPEPKEKW